MKTNRLLMAMTFVSVLLFGTSLYGQQEVDPTWYDPWPAPNKVAAPVTRPQAAKSKQQPKIVSSLPKENSGKVRAKRVVNRRTLSRFDLGLSNHSSGNWSIAGTPAFPSYSEVAFYCAGAGPAAMTDVQQMESPVPFSRRIT